MSDTPNDTPDDAVDPPVGPPISPSVDPSVDAAGSSESDSPFVTAGSGAYDELEDGVEDISPNRVAVALFFPVTGAAIMAGGVFTGVSPRIYAVVAGILGIALGLVVLRIKSAVVANVVTLLGIFGIGLVLIGPANIANAGDLASNAAREADLTRPPIDFNAGWQAIVGWLMGIVGFATTWLGVGVRKRSLALLVPLPFAAIAGISVPDNQQVASGVVVLVLFAVGLGMLSSINSFEGSERPPLAYELRKLAKSLPVIGVITVALIAISQTGFLFPDPQIDPAQEPQKPKTVPLTEVEDRVLFEVGPDIERGDTELLISGPWRMGTLSVYDGTDWRLPPVADNEFDDVPDDGILDDALAGRLGVRARFRILGLGGTVLPGLPLSAAIQSDGAPLAYDEQTNNVRVASGEVRSGQVYVIAAASLPSVDDLRLLGDSFDLEPALADLTDIPDAPPAVQALLDEADASFDNKWDKFDFLRTYILEEVVATGAGQPASIPPSRVQEILGDTLEASPFEIVAMQAMMGRWIGVPSRIGYGFDGGDKQGASLEIRPVHGASFVEVNFPGYGWLPVIGKPKQAKPTVGTDPGLQQTDPNILPSNDTAVQLYLPALTEPLKSYTRTVQVALAIAAGIALLLTLIYLLIPVIRKSSLRSRRRAAAREAGTRARIALAYAEWRDFAADYGFIHPNDTPLMFLDRFVDDPEHTELAWLTTRALWGDLRGDDDEMLAGAGEELSRALRRRLAGAQPGSMRFVATVSRISLRDPYAPATDLTGRPGSGSGRRSRRKRKGRDAIDELIAEANTPQAASAPIVIEEESDRVASQV